MRDAPANANVPLWIRKILLRGLRPTAGERFPSMGDLLDALGKNPATMRRKVAVAVAGGAAAGRARLRHPAEPGGSPGGVRRRTGEAGRRLGADASRRAASRARHARIKNAFLHTGKSYAADVHATVSRVLTGYAQSWANMYEEACEATQIRGEQSAEVLDLRMSCLQERLGGLRALTDVFSDANGEVVENAVSAANALASLDRCADVAAAAGGRAPARGSGDAREGGRAAPPAGGAEGALRRGPLEGGAEGGAGGRGGGARDRVPAAGRGDPGRWRAGVRSIQRREGGGEDAGRGVLGGGRVPARRGSRRPRRPSSSTSSATRRAVRGGRALVGNGGGGAAADGRARAAARVAAEQHRRPCAACKATRGGAAGGSSRRWR